MMNTAKKIETTAKVAYKKDTLHAWELTPQSLREIILFQKERLSTELMLVVPLTREFRAVLLDHSHFLGIRARDILLLRLASAACFDEALLYELCERTGRRVRLEALERARRRENRAAAWVIEESLGHDVPPEARPGLFAGLWQRFCGLAY